MKKNKNHISAWFLWESLALLHCSFSGNNGCKMQSAGVRTKDADHRHLSHTNALCAVFIAGTGKHPTEQIFPSFCRCFGNTEKARATLLYSLFGESASIAFDWSRNARALPAGGEDERKKHQQQAGEDGQRPDEEHGILGVSFHGKNLAKGRCAPQIRPRSRR